MLTPPPAPTALTALTGVAGDPISVLVIGRESVGKSQLIGTLAGRWAGEANFRGSTVSARRYRVGEVWYWDTPGVLRRSDTDTTRRALAVLAGEETYGAATNGSGTGGGDTVLLVVAATHLDEELAEMLPLVEGKRGVVVVTFWDKVEPGRRAAGAIDAISADIGVDLLTVDARSMTGAERTRVESAVRHPKPFIKSKPGVRCGWRIEPRRGILDHAVAGPLIGALLLVAPVLATVFGANAIAGWLHPIVESRLAGHVTVIRQEWPTWLSWVLTAEAEGFGYGLLNMGPFLLVWAFPTVLLFASVLAIYQASGLVERIHGTMDPLVRPIGLSGRDLLRVTMGLGCNVPAVISTRACSDCSRGNAIAAIAFGAPCSYQLPATLAVLAAWASATGTRPVWLALGFLAYLTLTTAIYLRLTASRPSRSPLNGLIAPRRPFLQWPTPTAVFREASGTVRQFALQAIPVFVLICLVAGALAEAGILSIAAGRIAPVMGWFRLPGETALAVLLASVRKDGIFLLAADTQVLSSMDAIQVLTAAYLAGVFLPCLVTALTIARETNWRSTSGLLLRQAGAALAFSWILAWGGRWVI